MPSKPYSTTPRRLERVRKTVFKKGLVELPCYEVEIDGRTLRYSATQDNAIAHGRVVTLFAKEPTTIPWLDSFTSDDVLLDIGANIGLYSIYAAVMRDCQVYCVEPEALNFAELNKNIYLNGLHGRVLAFCAAASTEMKVGELLLGAFASGYSHHDFGENTWLKDMKWSPDVSVGREERARQGSISVAIDQLVESGAIRMPTHIKIDVDGLEHRVIEGARQTLNDPRLKTVLVEIDFRHDATQAIIDAMVRDGWRYSYDQLIANRQMIMRKERVDELRKIKKDGFNFIFYKDEAYDALFRDFLAAYEPPYNERGQLKHAPVLVDR